MPSQPAGRDQQWLIVAIPGAVVVILLGAFLVIFTLRPKPKSAEESAPTSIARNQSPAKPSAPSAPTATPPATPAPPSPVTPSTVAAGSSTPGTSLLPSTPATPSTPSVATNDTTSPPAPAPPPAPAAPSPPKNLLNLINLPGDAVSGAWTLENGQLKNSDVKSTDHARVRLIPPPDGEYDFSMTFTTGAKPYVSQILSFKGKQFIWTYFQKDSGFAQVDGKGARQNPSNVQKGIKPNTKYTSVIKVRDNSVSAYLNGELYSTLNTDYSNLSLNAMWDLGAAKPLGIVAQCPITIEAITLTPIAPGTDSTSENSATPVATAPPAPAAPTPASAYKALARVITNSYSTQSSAGATQPAARAKPVVPDELQGCGCDERSQRFPDLATTIHQHPQRPQPPRPRTTRSSTPSRSPPAATAPASRPPIHCSSTPAPTIRPR